MANFLSLPNNDFNADYFAPIIGYTDHSKLEDLLDKSSAVNKDLPFALQVDKRLSQWRDYLFKNLEHSRYNFDVLKKMKDVATNIFRNMKAVEDHVAKNIISDQITRTSLNRSLELLNEIVFAILATPVVQLANTNGSEPYYKVQLQRIEAEKELRIRFEIKRSDRLTAKVDDQWKTKLMELYLSLTTPQQIKEFAEEAKLPQILEIVKVSLADRKLQNSRELQNNLSTFIFSLSFEKIEQFLGTQTREVLKKIAPILNCDAQLAQPILTKLKAKLQDHTKQVMSLQTFLKGESEWQKYNSTHLLKITELKAEIDKVYQNILKLENLLKDFKLADLDKFASEYETLQAILEDTSKQDLEVVGDDNVYQIMTKQAFKEIQDGDDILGKVFGRWDIVTIDDYKALGLFEGISEETIASWKAKAKDKNPNYDLKSYEGFSQAAGRLARIGLETLNDLIREKIYNKQMFIAFIASKKSEFLE